jgi:uncharacterized protein
MLAKTDESVPVWEPAKLDEAVLRPGYRPSCLVAEDRRLKLAALGVNTIQAVRSAARVGANPRTLAAGTAGASEWRYLASRRLALLIVNSIARGTRWIAVAQPHVEVTDMVTAQVREFFEQLHETGAFGTRAMEDSFYVICDRPAAASAVSQEFQLVIGFAAARDQEFHSFRISQSASGTKVQPVSLNRLNSALYSPEELNWVDNLAGQLRP